VEFFDGEQRLIKDYTSQQGTPKKESKKIHMTQNYGDLFD